jgi:hypothetical protein
MAKKTATPEVTPEVTPEATPEVTTASVPTPESDLAFRICARTGMGLTICRERMKGNEDVLESLLVSNEIASIMAILEPSNKA